MNGSVKITVEKFDERGDGRYAIAEPPTWRWTVTSLSGETSGIANDLTSAFEAAELAAYRRMRGPAWVRP